MMNQIPTTDDSIITSTLHNLTPSQLSSLSQTLSSTFHRHHHHLASLLSSPTLFSLTLNYLYSLSLPHKSRLIAHHLLSFLHLLTSFSQPRITPITAAPAATLRDLDAVSLLLLFCDLRQQNPSLLESSPPGDWQQILFSHFIKSSLSISGMITSPADVLSNFVDILVKCIRFVGAAPGKAVGKSAASVRVVVALPSVVVRRRGGGGLEECAVCKEEMAEGREVCELPCGHMFHWVCVLPWFRKRNTCPCCRFALPTDDVYGEIQRLWGAIVKAGRSQLHGDQCS